MLQLTDELPPLWLIANYLLEFFPGSRAVLVRDISYLVDGLVNPFFIGGSNLNAGFAYNILYVAKIAGHKVTSWNGY